jgi:hypothetical protein
MKKTRGVLVAAAAAYVAAVGLEGLVQAKAAWVKKSKDMGLPAENCLYCHTEKMPKKDTFKVDALNDRGKWLVSEKDKRKAKEIEVEWLKDYPGGKEQK